MKENEKKQGRISRCSHLEAIFRSFIKYILEDNNIISDSVISSMISNKYDNAINDEMHYQEIISILNRPTAIEKLNMISFQLFLSLFFYTWPSVFEFTMFEI